VKSACSLCKTVAWEQGITGKSKKKAQTINEKTGLRFYPARQASEVIRTRKAAQ